VDREENNREIKDRKQFSSYEDKHILPLLSNAKDTV